MVDASELQKQLQLRASRRVSQANLPRYNENSTIADAIDKTEEHTTETDVLHDETQEHLDDVYDESSDQQGETYHAFRDSIGSELDVYGVRGGNDDDEEDDDDEFSFSDEDEENETVTHGNLLNGLRKTIEEKVVDTEETPNGENVTHDDDELEMAKHYLQAQDQVWNWIRKVMGLDLDLSPGGLFELISDGILLCELMISLIPDCIKTIHRSYSVVKAPLCEKENISSFLRCCREKFRMNPSECFTANELYNRENIPKVMFCIRLLSEYANQKLSKKDLSWPHGSIASEYSNEILRGAMSEMKYLSTEKKEYIMKLINMTPKGISQLRASIPTSVETDYIMPSSPSNKFSTDLQFKLQKRLPAFSEDNASVKSFSSGEEEEDDYFHEQFYSNKNDSKQLAPKFAAKTNTVQRHQPHSTSNDHHIPNAVSSWLNSIGLSQYAHTFEEDGWDDMHVVSDISEDELKDMGITKRGHIRKILRACKEWTPPANVNGNESDTATNVMHQIDDDAWREQMGAVVDKSDAKEVFNQYKAMQNEFKKLRIADATLRSSITMLSCIGEEFVRSLVPYSVPIVVDIGWNTFKIGFANDETPSFLLPAVIASPKDSAGKMLVGKRMLKDLEGCRFRYPMHKGIDTISEPAVVHWEDIEHLLKNMYVNILRVVPNRHPLLICEPEFFRPVHREKLREIVYNKLGVELAYFARPSPLVLKTAGVNKGVVLNIGESFSSACAVNDNMLIKDASMISPIAGNQLTELMMRHLAEEGCDFKSIFSPQRSDGWISGRAFQEFETARVIKERTCYVSKSNGLHVSKVPELCVSAESLPSHLRDFLPRATHAPYINLGRARCKIPEALFHPSIIRKDEFYKGGSLQGIVKEAISRCPFSMQKSMWENVVVCGGTSTCPGLVERLQKMLKDISPGEYQPAVQSLRDPSLAVWRGGALLAIERDFQRQWVSNSAYQNQVINKTFPTNDVILSEPSPKEMFNKASNFVGAMDDLARSLQSLNSGEIDVLLEQTKQGSSNAMSEATQDILDQSVSVYSLASDSASLGSAPVRSDFPSTSRVGSSSLVNTSTILSESKITEPIVGENNMKAAIISGSPQRSDVGSRTAEEKEEVSSQLAEPMKDSLDRMNKYMESNRYPLLLQVDIRVFICESFATGDFGQNKSMDVADILMSLPTEIQERIRQVGLEIDPDRDAHKAIEIAVRNDNNASMDGPQDDEYFENNSESYDEQESSSDLMDAMAI